MRRPGVQSGVIQMPHYIRAYIPGACYFFTVGLLEHRRYSLTENLNVLWDAFRTVRKERFFFIDAIVVLPEHLHCIWTLPEGDADVLTRWRLIKARFTRNVPGGQRRSIRRPVKAERGIWQRSRALRRL
jgi:putative transposase